MKHILNIVPDPEKTIINELKKHLYEEVRFGEIYPEFGDIRVSATHPFAYLMDQEMNNNKVPVGLFPSITIVNDTDNRNPGLAMQKQVSTDITITSAEIADIKANRDKYIISDKDLRELEDLVSAATNNIVYASGVESYMKASMVVEIWSENQDVKSAIYDIVRNFLLGINRFTIQERFGIIILEASIRGEKSGNYNFDFGFMICGGILRFEADFTTRQYVVATDVAFADLEIKEVGQSPLSKVTHSYEEINPDE